jgi:VIT1/CCC1 family predicted Fe2+/Mn2+ transporter
MSPVEQPAFDVRHLDPEWLTQHLVEERQEADLLGEIREAIFGAQDGVTSILIVVITVATATSNSYAVLVAGIAAALAEVISMAAGEYMSSRSQREIFLAQIERERQEVRDRPGESEAEVAMLLQQEGLPADVAKRAAAELARDPNVLLKTMVEKELGIIPDAGPSALQGAVILAVTFAAAALIPLLPFFFLPVRTAMIAAISLSAVSMFVLGVVKARLTKRNPIVSGLEIVALVAAASAGGFITGTLLPRALGFLAVP